jgi:hypothetical protein
MKVYQIISEAAPQYNPGAQSRRAARRIAPPAVSTPAPSTVAPTPAATNKLGDIVKKRHAIWKTGNAEAAAKMEAGFFARVGGTFAWLLKKIGLGAALWDLWIDLSGLEDLYNNKELSKEDYEAEREFAFGIFEAQILAPFIIRFVSRSMEVLLLAKVIKNVVLTAGVVAGVATGGVVSAASIATMIATEAGITAFQLWLGSDQGKDYLGKQIFMPYIRGAGYVGEGIWNKLLYAFSNSSFYKDAEKKQGQFQNKKALDTAKTPQEKQAAQQAIDTAKATQDRSDDIDALQAKLK